MKFLKKIGTWLLEEMKRQGDLAQKVGNME